MENFHYDAFDNINRYQKLQPSTLIPNPTSSLYLEPESVISTNENYCFVCCVYHWYKDPDNVFEPLNPGQLNYVPTFNKVTHLHSLFSQHEFPIE